MKKLMTLAALMVSAICLAETPTRHLSSWKMSCEGSLEIYDVTTPSTVEGALADLGVLPTDKSVFDKAWTYTTTFRVKGGKGLRHILRFESLGFYADITLNDKIIASSDTTFGVFVPREFDITDDVRRFGKNTLSVTLHRAQKGDLNHGFVDWNPRPMGESMGILGNVTLKSVSPVQLADLFVKSEFGAADLSSADLQLEATYINRSSKTVYGTANFSLEGESFSLPLTLAPGSTTVTLTPSQWAKLHVDNPRVWWTWDLGTPELYTIDASFAVKGKVSDRRDAVFGIRSITSTVDESKARQFYLNGVPVLVRGAGWTDEMMFRDTHESNFIQAQLVKDMGMNCIRFENIWGKDDNIYDACDRLGLMAMVGWSCQWEWEDYCGLPETRGFGCINDPRSEDLAVEYFRNQVVRLRNHPAIICWLLGSDRIPNERLEARYMEIYDKCEYRPYVCSAKNIKSRFGGQSGLKMEGPYEYVGPDYWYVDTHNGGAFGFNSETGVGMNLPQLPSLRRMLGEENLWPLSQEWNRHCTASASAMNSPEVMTRTIEGYFGGASSLEEYVAMAHAIDYAATRSMFEAFRCNVPRSTGIIQWMLNSAWPSLYWQLYDFYLAPTSAYYGTQKACETSQLIYNYKDRQVYLVCNDLGGVTANASLKIYGADGSTLLCNENKIAHASYNAPVAVFDIPQYGEGVFVSLELASESGSVLAENFYTIPEKDNVYNWKKANWYITPITEYSDLRYVKNLAAAQLEVDSQMIGDNLIVRLTNKSGVISYQNILRVLDEDGNIIAPAFWSDNFVNLLPGESKTLTCQLPGGKQGRLDIQTWNSELL